VSKPPGELKATRERDGLVVLQAPRGVHSGVQFRPGDKVRVKTGPLVGFPGLISTMKPRQRVEVLLQMLGGLQRVELAATAVERLA
jgi:transcription antitermination factor NusG